MAQATLEPVVGSLFSTLGVTLVSSRVGRGWVLTFPVSFIGAPEGLGTTASSAVQISRGRSAICCSCSALELIKRPPIHLSQMSVEEEVFRIGKQLEKIVGKDAEASSRK